MMKPRDQSSAVAWIAKSEQTKRHSQEVCPDSILDRTLLEVWTIQPSFYGVRAEARSSKKHLFEP